MAENREKSLSKAQDDALKMSCFENKPKILN